jgi:hypothetical protein
MLSPVTLKQRGRVPIVTGMNKERGCLVSPERLATDHGARPTRADTGGRATIQVEITAGCVAGTSEPRTSAYSRSVGVEDFDVIDFLHCLGLALPEAEEVTLLARDVARRDACENMTLYF